MYKNCPRVFKDYLQYVESLKFDQCPNYDYLRSLLKDAFKEKGFTMDFEWDWIIMKQLLIQQRDEREQEMEHVKLLEHLSGVQVSPEKKSSQMKELQERQQKVRRQLLNTMTMRKTKQQNENSPEKTKCELLRNEIAQRNHLKIQRLMLEEVEAARRIKTEPSDRMLIEDQQPPRESLVKDLQGSFNSETSELLDDDDASPEVSENKSHASSHLTRKSKNLRVTVEN